MWKTCQTGLPTRFYIAKNNIENLYKTMDLINGINIEKLFRNL